ncbi:glycerophosphodiester phosphodiesterase GDPD5 isoform X2 [Folsomia candida]|uniref:glycerophosphodiester phosphodiesterase GDPD5 isoform X2 n=1 Tax=Folsomia candida TaxID=158441 RepID=UPI000B8EEF51|nr:glycerophosphodiester phosphodiesterase GDPD5 isoform X2 [Folsomia candida]
MKNFQTILTISLLCLGLSSGGKLKDPSKFRADKISMRNGRQVGKWPTLSGDPIKIMAHRGEKVFMPEHTVGSYELASIEGAEYVEPDLVLTKDGHLVCFHDLTLKTGTDVALLSQFDHKKKNFTGVIDEGMGNVTITDDWFIKDFTLDELKVLKVIQKDVGIRPQRFNNMFGIPTFEDYLTTVHHNAFRLNKSVGIIPELKHPMFHNLDYPNSPRYMEELVLSTLSKWGYPMTDDGTPENCISPQDAGAQIKCGHLILQSFELECIKYLAQVTHRDRMMLIDIQLPLLTYKGLQDVTNYANYYAVWKELLYTGIEAQIEAQGIEYDKNIIELGGFIPARDIVVEAHALGLEVGIYTIYDSREPSRRGCVSGNCDPENKEMELYFYFEMGVDGMFVENVGEAREIRQSYQFSVVDGNEKAGGSRQAVFLTRWRFLECFIVLFIYLEY